MNGKFLQNKTGRKLRPSNYVVPPVSSDDFSSDTVSYDENEFLVNVIAENALTVVQNRIFPLLNYGEESERVGFVNETNKILRQLMMTHTQSRIKYKNACVCLTRRLTYIQGRI